MDLGRMLAQTAERFPDKTAIIFRDHQTNYSEFNQRANQVANALIAQGVEPGDRVALFMHNIPLFMEAYYGIVKAGASVVPMNVLYKPGEVEYILKDSGAKALMTFATPAAPYYMSALAAAANAPDLRAIIVAAPEPVPNTLSWAEAVGGVSSDAPNVEVHPEQVAVICYTSGTTGRPKGAMLSHRNLLANCEQCMMLPAIAVRPDDVVWLALPLFHIYAMNVGMNLSVMNGGTMVLIERFEPASSLDAIQKHKCTVLYGAPPMFVAWSQIPNIHDYDLTSLRYVASGAAALPVKIMETFQGLSGVPISEGYGLSESSPVLTSNAAGPATKPGTVGPAIPGVEIKIVDEAGVELPHGQMGELIARGPNIMMGYWRQPEATAETLKDGWLHTGDLAIQDDDGYFSIVDRKKDMIVVSGYNVYPREVEETLFRHPAVAEAAVVQYPDPYQGESVMAFVVLKQGESASEQDIIDFCRSQIAVFKCPRKIAFVDALPKNNTGKVLRRELRDQAEQMVGSGA
ncbi:MAG TPA: long-chain fatty acid--CoA ligase [Ktedonobacterales bacterium]|nr:long-chain fatty acid--CoA ligase [Ktedonobacterales bacterium]